MPLGTIAAIYQNSPLDHALRVITVSGVALPMFWLGLMLQFFLSLQIDLFPLSGQIDAMTDPPEPITRLILDGLPAARTNSTPSSTPPITSCCRP